MSVAQGRSHPVRHGAGCDVARSYAAPPTGWGGPLEHRSAGPVCIAPQDRCMPL